MNFWTHRFVRWLHSIYWLNALPFRHWLDPLISKVRVAKATLFPRRDYHLREFRVAVTNACNAACCFCAYPQTKMKRHIMTLDTFLQALPYVSHQYLVDLTPAVGEPLIDPGLKEKADALIARGLKIQFTTNAILLDKHQWLLEPHYIRHIERIFFSIPSYDPAQYAIQYGVDKGQQVIAGLLNFLSLNETLGQPLRLFIQIRNREKPGQTRNSAHYQLFKPYIHGRVAQHFTGTWDNWSGALDLNTWSEHMLGRLRVRPQINRPCSNLRMGLVNPDGGLRLCGCRVIKTDQDGLLVGKIGDSMEQLNTNAREIRNGFYAGNRPEVCQSCSFYNAE